MSIFETVGEKFFSPFCCRNREIYFACIRRLIETSKEIPVLYETDARNALILYLQNCQYAMEREEIGEETVGGERSPQENASAILRYFRACGWITPQEIGRSGDNLASVTAYCRKLVDALQKIFEGGADGAITNHVFSMYEILKGAFGKDSPRALRPYVNLLEPLTEHKLDLKNELLTLKDSIRTIMRAVMRMADANSFGRFLIRDQLLNRFFNDYFFIKKSGLVPSYLAKIDRMLRRLRRSELYGRMVLEYRQRKQVEEPAAREVIDRQFEALDSFINLEYPEEMDYIDRKINTYYHLYATRMMMVLSGNTNLEHQLNRLLLSLKDLPAAEREAALGRLGETHRLISVGYIGRKSLERRRKPNPNRKSAGVAEDSLSQEELERMTEELLAGSQDRYSMERAGQHWERLLAGRDRIPVEACGIRTREDAMMVAAAILYAGEPGFPYGVEWEEGTVETPAARISHVTIERRPPDTEPGPGTGKGEAYE